MKLILFCISDQELIRDNKYLFISFEQIFVKLRKQFKKFNRLIAKMYNTEERHRNN